MNIPYSPSPEATKQGVCHTDTECMHMYADIDDGLKAPALAMLKISLEPVLTDIRLAYNKSPKDWTVGYHFGWGMAVRNLLREKGFGEDYFKVHNLDDIYAPLVEEALQLSAIFD